MKMILLVITISLFCLNAQAVDRDYCSQLGHWGYGACRALEIVGTTGFVGSGSVLEVVDFSDPENSTLIGDLALPDTILDLFIEGERAYVCTAAGLHIIDLTDLSNPAELGSNTILRGCRGIAIAGNYAYLALGFSLVIASIHDPEDAYIVGALGDLGYATEVAVANDRAYVTTELPGYLHIADVSNPAEPTLLGSYASPSSYVHEVVVDGNIAYVSEKSEGLRILDVTNPSSITELGFFDAAGFVYDLEILEGLALLANGSGGMIVIDLSDLANPAEIGRFSPTYLDASILALDGDRIFVAGWHSYNLGLRVVDITIPSTPTEIGSRETLFGVGEIKVRNGIAYVSGGTGFQTFDVSDPVNPVALGSGDAGIGSIIVLLENLALGGNNRFLSIFDISDPGSPTLLGTLDDMWHGPISGVAAQETLAFLVGGFMDGLRIVDISDPTDPSIIGIYDIGESSQDVAVNGEFAYVTFQNVGLQVIDISIPTAPTLRGTSTEPSSGGSIVFQNNIVYVSGGGELNIIDVSNPDNPVHLGVWGGTNSPGGVEVEGNLAFVTDHGELIVVDVSDPASPTEVGSFYAPGYPSYPRLGDADAGLAYVSCSDAGFVIVSYDGPSGLWSDVTSELLGNYGYNNGAAWGDYDNDGYEDLIITCSHSGYDRLLHNDGGSSFTNATDSIASNWGYMRSAVWGDYNNDGYLDVFLSGAGGNRLYENTGLGTFSYNASSPLGGAGDTYCSAWADFDNDGLLDIYISNYSPDNYDATNRLLRNDGDGGFTDVTSGALAIGEFSIGVAFGDYDNDGDLDLYVGMENGPNKLIRNDGNGDFSDVSATPLDDQGETFGVAWGDYDNDQDLDLFVANYDRANRLYRNEGDGTFFDVSNHVIMNPNASVDVSWADYDNDGDLDIYVTNRGSSNQLLRNEGGDWFGDASDDPLSLPYQSSGATWGDYDNDGDPDLFVTAYVGENRLFRNDQPGTNHWLQLRLKGTDSNSAGIGARVKIVSGGMTQIREVSGGSGYCSQNSLRVSFGLGSAEIVDTLSIRWPSGVVQDTTMILADQFLEIIEHDAVVDVDLENIPLAFSLENNYPNPFNPKTTLRFNIPGRTRVNLSIYDVSGRLVATLVDGLVNGGNHEVTWDGRDEGGRPIASGIYFSSLRSDEISLKRKMLLMK